MMAMKTNNKQAKAMNTHSNRVNPAQRAIKAIVLAAAVMTTLASCDDFLDELPDNRMEIDSADDVASLLVSAYATAYPAYILEMYSDNSDCIDNTGWTEVDRMQRQAFWWDDITETSSNESPQNLWDDSYGSIAAANAALEYIDELSGSSTEDFSEQMGEALLCRAYAMFMLSTIFCEAYDETTAASKLGLPYPLKTETTVGQTYERGTLEELYQKIDADLQKGLPLVGNSYSVPKYHFNPKAAYAFAARFYLNYRDYEKVVEYANAVLGSDPTQMLRDWESISSLSVNDQVMPEAYIASSETANLMLIAAYSEWGAICGPFSYGDRYFHGSVLSRTETLQSQGPWGESENFRYGAIWYNNSLSKYMHRKVPYEFEYTDKTAGIGYAHSVFSAFNTDMLLMDRAEAEAMLGDYDAAVDDINAELSVFHEEAPQLLLDSITDYYNRLAYYEPMAPTPKKRFNTSFAIEETTQEPLLHCILHLRRILSIHEGQRMQDVKRYGIEIYRRTVNKSDEYLSIDDVMEPDDPRRAIQIPADVISAGLEANPRN